MTQPGLTKTAIFISLILGVSAVAYGASETALLSNNKSAQAGNSINQAAGKDVAIYVFEDELRSVISEIVRRDNVSVKMENEIRGIVQKKLLKGGKAELLEKLSQEHAFDWFEYNNTLYVSSKSNRSTKFFSISSEVFRQLLGKLEKAGVNTGGFQVQYLDNKTVSVSGPPNYIAIVETMVDSLHPDRKKANRAEFNVSVYRGVKLQRIEVDKTGSH